MSDGEGEHKAIVAPFLHSLDCALVLTEPTRADVRRKHILSLGQHMGNVVFIIVNTVMHFVIYRIQCIRQIPFAVIRLRRH